MCTTAVLAGSRLSCFDADRNMTNRPYSPAQSKYNRKRYITEMLSHSHWYLNAPFIVI